MRLAMTPKMLLYDKSFDLQFPGPWTSRTVSMDKSHGLVSEGNGLPRPDTSRSLYLAPDPHFFSVVLIL